MKLSKYAKQLGISYQTAWKHFKAGLIPSAYQLSTGTIIVPDVINPGKKDGCNVILYARVSTVNQKDALEIQAKRLESYAIAKGYTIKRIVKEIGSGINDRRKRLTEVLEKDDFDKIIVEHKDRLTRFGFQWFQVLTKNRIEVINEATSELGDITADLIAIIHSFSSRVYGLRRKTRKVIEIINE